MEYFIAGVLGAILYRFIDRWEQKGKIVATMSNKTSTIAVHHDDYVIKKDTDISGNDVTAVVRK